MKAVADLQKVVDDDDIESLEGLQSVDDSLPSWCVEEAIDIDNDEEAAQYADLTDEE